MCEREEIPVELPKMVDCINGDCNGLMVEENGLYGCQSCRDTTTKKSIQRRIEEAKQVVVA